MCTAHTAAASFPRKIYFSIFNCCECGCMCINIFWQLTQCENFHLLYDKIKLERKRKNNVVLNKTLANKKGITSRFNQKFNTN